MAKFSIIIPVYNVEKYLRECLDSVINQTFKDIEIICVNDGSPDNSLSILKEYADKDKRIKIIDQENTGLSRARNSGLDILSGKYCYFLDSDDYIEPDLFEHANKIFENFDIDYFCFGSEVFVDGECVQSIEDLNNDIKIKRNGLFELDFPIGLNTNIHVWNKIFKTSMIKEHNIRFIDKLIYEDIYFTWYYFFLSSKAYYDSTIYHHYRVHSNSTMEVTTQHKRFDTGIAHMYNWYELFKSVSRNVALFSKTYGYDIFLYLLNQYYKRTIEMVPTGDKHRVKLLKVKYQKELEKFYHVNIGSKFFQCVFSIKNSIDNKHVIICCCGIKLKVKRKK